MSYLPIENHGIIGDLRSVALVGTDGTIDWCCLPRFDSPSIFASILDDRKGGHFRIGPQDGVRTKQLYIPDTNVLITRFMTTEGMAELIDFMPIGTEAGGQSEQGSRQIIRMVQVVRGSMQFHLECMPAFDYARKSHEMHFLDHDTGALFSAEDQQFVLKGPFTLHREGTGVKACFTLKACESAVFALRHRDGHADRYLHDEGLDGEALLRETIRFWRTWLSHSKYRGRWREMVHRSALLLKLLTYHPTGAIVAAPTTSLPEQIGGPRNWDYRYTWVRDAAFSVYALMRLGFTEEAGAFSEFMQARAKEEESEDGPLNVLYGITGEHHIVEQTLDHLDGYCGSKPVRIGNAAYGHLQLDIYGELMDSIYLYDKYGAMTSYDTWVQVSRMLDWLTDNWDQPDQSIWEVRGGRQQFTYSKLQCWVAFDRGIRLSLKHGLPANHAWVVERNKVYESIMRRCWDEKTHSFTQYYGSDTVDASVLLMPLMLFVAPTDPRMVSTLERVRKELTSDSLVRRYKIGEAADDGLPGGEGSFSICSFWLAEAMARAGYVEEGELIFEKMLTYANGLGLFSEEIGETGEALGNFPQAFTHLGLISAAFNLNRSLGGEGGDRTPGRIRRLTTFDQTGLSG